MDAGNIIIENGNSTHHTNGVGEELPLPVEEGLSLGEVNEAQRTKQLYGTSESIPHLESNAAIQSFMGNVKDASIVHEQGNTSNASQKSTAKDPYPSDHSKSQKRQGKVKNSGDGKPSGPKHAVATWVRKTKNGNQEDASSTMSNGLQTKTSHSKQPSALTANGGSFNDRQAVEGNAGIDSGRPARSTSAPSSVLNFKKSGKSGSASFAANDLQPEGVESLKFLSRCTGLAKDLKPLKRGTSKVAENSLSASLSPTVAGSKPRRIGTTPSYSFSFRCNERADKRKEFYSKLEEKIHAKELEKTDMPAKSKETQAAEIKILRKSLTFKAKPMPSFYQEPAPPKVELEKVPVTRPRSPILGRHKSLPTPGTEGYGSRFSQTGRLSLDNKVSRNSLAKKPPQHAKMPFRKSLPKLPSEKSAGTNVTDGSPPKPLSGPHDSDDTEKGMETDANQDRSMSTEKQLKSARQETVNKAEPSAGIEQH